MYLKVLVGVTAGILGCLAIGSFAIKNVISRNIDEIIKNDDTNTDPKETS